MDVFNDYLPNILRIAQELHTHTCTWCEGTGQQPAWMAGPCSNPLHAPTETACSTCGGTGQFVPDEFHAHVVASVLIDIVSSAVMFRDSSRFNTMNDLLDAGANYISALIAKEVTHYADDPDYLARVQQARERFFARTATGSSNLPLGTSAPIDNALTPDEIAALGLGDAP